MANFSLEVLHMVEIASLALGDRVGMTQKDVLLNISHVFLRIIINPLHPNISMHILHTVLYTCPEALT